MLSNTLLAISLLPVALAHFKLIYPAPRGFDEDKEPTFPCGGFNDVQQQRTDFSMSGSNLQLNMGHEQSNTAVYMAVGNNPGSAFNTVLRQQFTISGIGDFCIGGVSVPAGMNISDGTPATIQVVTNGDGKGGLYQCVDVTLRTGSVGDSSSHCTNGTNVAVSQQNISGNPNGTSTASASGSPSPTAKAGAAPQAKAGAWTLGVVGAAALALL